MLSIKTDKATKSAGSHFEKVMEGEMSNFKCFWTGI